MPEETKTETTPAPPAASPETKPEQKPSLSKSLFPDFQGPDGKILDKPAVQAPSWQPGAKPSAPPPPPAPAPAPEAKKETEPPALVAPPPPAPNTDYLDLAQTSGKKVKVKVNGVELETTVDELVKNHQLSAHLTQKAQKLADQERDVKKLMEEITSKPALPTGDEPGDEPPAPAPAAKKKPGETDAQFEKRLERIEAGLAQLAEVTRDQRFDKGINDLAKQIEAETGFNDFKEFVPEIKAFVLANVRDPRNPTPQEAYYDTAEFYKMKFLEMKAKKLATPAAPPAPPAPTKPSPAIPPATEAGGGVSSSTEFDDWKTRYDAAFEKAVESGRDDDWQEVLRLKRETPA